MLRKMTIPKMEKRYSCEECLQHPWFEMVKEETTSPEQLERALDSMRDFSQFGKSAQKSAQDDVALYESESVFGGLRE